MALGGVLVTFDAYVDTLVDGQVVVAVVTATLGGGASGRW